MTIPATMSGISKGKAKRLKPVNESEQAPEPIALQLAMPKPKNKQERTVLGLILQCSTAKTPVEKHFVIFSLTKALKEFYQFRLDYKKQNPEAGPDDSYPVFEEELKSSARNAALIIPSNLDIKNIIQELNTIFADEFSETDDGYWSVAVGYFVRFALEDLASEQKINATIQEIKTGDLPLATSAEYKNALIYFLQIKELPSSQKLAFYQTLQGDTKDSNMLALRSAFLDIYRLVLTPQKLRVALRFFDILSQTETISVEARLNHYQQELQAYEELQEARASLETSKAGDYGETFVKMAKKGLTLSVSPKKELDIQNKVKVFRNEEAAHQRNLARQQALENNPYISYTLRKRALLILTRENYTPVAKEIEYITKRKQEAAQAKIDVLLEAYQNLPEASVKLADPIIKLLQNQNKTATERLEELDECRISVLRAVCKEMENKTNLLGAYNRSDIRTLSVIVASRKATDPSSNRECLIQFEKQAMVLSTQEISGKNKSYMRTLFNLYIPKLLDIINPNRHKQRELFSQAINLSSALPGIYSTPGAGHSPSPSSHFVKNTNPQPG